MLRTDDGIVVASEPYDDDPRWADVPDHHLVDVTADTVTITDLEAVMPAENRVQAQPGRYLDALRADVRAGLTATPKTLPPKYFYDARGSELFDEITRLPEYYLTRAETSILRAAHAAQIAELARCESLVELGSGTSAKTRLLLRALLDGGTLREFVPFDVDPAVLTDATERAGRGVPGPADRAVRRRLRPAISAPFRHRGRRMIVFLGSTIGNLEPQARCGLPRRRSGLRSVPGIPSSSGRTWSRTPTGCSARTTTRPE